MARCGLKADFVDVISQLLTSTIAPANTCTENLLIDHTSLPHRGMGTIVGLPVTRKCFHMLLL